MKIAGTTILLLFASLLTAVEVGAQQVDVPLKPWGAVFSLPEGWSIVDTTRGIPGSGAPLYRLAATDSAGQSLTLHILQAPKWWVVSSPEVQGRITQSMFGDGASITDARVVRHGSEEAYRFDGVWKRDSFSMRVAGLFILANGYGYSLSFTTLSKMSPFEHPHIASILSSFHFTSPPESHFNPDTLSPYRVDRPEEGISLQLPGSWENLPIDPASDPGLVVRAANLTRERAIYIERIGDFPPLEPDDSLLVAEMTGRLEKSGFAVTVAPKVVNFNGSRALSLKGEIRGEAKAQLLVIPGEGVATTVTVVLQGEWAKKGDDILLDPVIRPILESLRISS